MLQCSRTCCSWQSAWRYDLGGAVLHVPASEPNRVVRSRGGPRDVGLSGGRRKSRRLLFWRVPFASEPPYALWLRGAARISVVSRSPTVERPSYHERPLTLCWRRSASASRVRGAEPFVVGALGATLVHHTSRSPCQANPCSREGAVLPTSAEHPSRGGSGVTPVSSTDR